MAGQGTCGLEITQQIKAADSSLDALLVCCGGGGLTAGICVAMQELSPNTHIFAVEPHQFDDHARSLASGQRQINKHPSGSICDALLAPTPGVLTFAVNEHLLHDVLTVTDEEVRQALKVAFATLKLVLEPGGAAALAAFLSNKLPSNYKNVGIVLTGGNVDPQAFQQFILD